MTGSANSEQLQIDSTKTLNQALVAATFLIQVGCQTVRQMRIPRLDVHMPEQMLIHVMTVGVWIGGKQADVFIQIKSAAKRKIELLFLVPADEMAINAFHGLASGQAQNEVRVGTEVMGDDARNKGRSSFVSGLYDYFHK